jgi:hypothetical protein
MSGTKVPDIFNVMFLFWHPSYDPKSTLQSFGESLYKWGMIKKSEKYF